MRKIEVIRKIEVLREISDTPMKAGEIIREIRKQKGLSRDEVIQRNPFWSYQSWGRLERGDRRLSIEEVKEVAIAFNMDTVELFLLLVDGVDKRSRKNT